MKNDLLREVYERYSRELFIYCYSLCKSRQAAEDIMQETFLKAIISLPDEHMNIRAWLYMVARNLFLNQARINSRMTGDEVSEMPEMSDKSAEDEMLARLQNKQLYGAVMRLDTRKREIIMLQYFSGFSHDYIAKLTGLTPANVRTLSHRAKKELKAIMEENEQ